MASAQRIDDGYAVVAQYARLNIRASESKLRVLAECLGTRQRQAVQVLASNNTPVLPCVVCGKEATRVYTQCIDAESGWLCDACAPEHKWGEMCLPMMNSLRVGMCGRIG